MMMIAPFGFQYVLYGSSLEYEFCASIETTSFMADDPQACFSVEHLRFLANAECMQVPVLIDLGCLQVLFSPDELLMDGVLALDIVPAANETGAKHS